MACGKKDRINHTEIEQLSSQLFDDKDMPLVKVITEFRESTVAPHWKLGQRATTDAMRLVMSPLEQKIGGKGIDDLLYGKKKLQYCGNWEMKDRSLYRTLQYALIRILWVYMPRESILFSCEHVQHALKKRLRIEVPRAGNRSLGSLIREARERGLLDQALLAQLDLINRIGRIAKHEYGEDSIRIDDSDSEMRSQVFTLIEAFSMYFVCRKIGVLLV